MSSVRPQSAAHTPETGESKLQLNFTSPRAARWVNFSIGSF